MSPFLARRQPGPSLLPFRKSPSKCCQCSSFSPQISCPYPCLRDSWKPPMYFSPELRLFVLPSPIRQPQAQVPSQTVFWVFLYILPCPESTSSCHSPSYLSPLAYKFSPSPYFLPLAQNPQQCPPCGNTVLPNPCSRLSFHCPVCTLPLAQTNLPAPWQSPSWNSPSQLIQRCPQANRQTPFPWYRFQRKCPLQQLESSQQNSPQPWYWSWEQLPQQTRLRLSLKWYSPQTRLSFWKLPRYWWPSLAQLASTLLLGRLYSKSPTSYLCFECCKQKPYPCLPDCRNIPRYESWQGSVSWPKPEMV